MTRSTWIVTLLLLGTNAAWLIAWQGDGGSGSTDSFTVVEQEETIAALQEEIAERRRAEPILMGGGSREPGADPSAEGADASHGGDSSTASGADVGVEAPPSAEDLAKAKAQREALARAKDMLRKVMQVADPALRQEGLREISDALAGDDEALIEYTLSVLYSLRDAEIDRRGFLGRVREHLDSENGGIRRAALYALHAVDPEAADLRLPLAGASDPDPIVRCHIAKLLGIYGGAQLTDESAAVVLGLLADDNAMVRKGTLRGLAGTQATPELAKQLLELAKNPATRREAVQFGLSTQPKKSREVVDALFTYLRDEDAAVRKRAHWGLQRGVPKETQRYVATQYAERLDTFLAARTQKEALALIVRYGDAGLAPQLERFAENELLKADVRALARKAAGYLVRREESR